MAKLSARTNPGNQSAVITVDGAVVGGIRMTGPDEYTVDTGGQVPGIDGLQGASMKEAHEAVAAKVRAGGVFVIFPVEMEA